MAAEGDGGDLAVPPTIQALLAARLDRSTRGARRARARLGRGPGLPPRRRARARARRSPSRRRGLTAPRPQGARPPRAADAAGEEPIRFRHLLIRDAAYDALPKAARAELHERFARLARRARPATSSSATRSSATTSSRRSATEPSWGRSTTRRGRSRAARRSGLPQAAGRRSSGTTPPERPRSSAARPTSSPRTIPGVQPCSPIWRRRSTTAARSRPLSRAPTRRSGSPRRSGTNEPPPAQGCGG